MKGRECNYQTSRSRTHYVPSKTQRKKKEKQLIASPQHFHSNGKPENIISKINSMSFLSFLTINSWLVLCASFLCGVCDWCVVCGVVCGCGCEVWCVMCDVWCVVCVMWCGVLWCVVCVGEDGATGALCVVLLTVLLARYEALQMIPSLSLLCTSIT
jgi:hypothetical protein